MPTSRYEGRIEQVDAYRWRLPQDEHAGMRTDGVIYADEGLMADMVSDPALLQVRNVACLPGIIGHALAMPDFHYGYGFPIGGVAAEDVREGVISPGGVGYDINCGVRLLRTDLTRQQLQPRMQELVDALYGSVPAGVGGRRGEGQIRLEVGELRQVLRRGGRWAVENGHGWPEDLEVTEERGELAGADAELMSPRALERGLPQLGTLGSGNHFLEVQAVDEIYDKAAAAALGLEAVGQVTVMIHSGSRGLGHQTCDDALETMQDAVRKYGLQLPDRQLACAPVDSPEGQAYFATMACAANYAWANRQCLAQAVREVFERVLKSSARALGMHQVYDVAHNIAKFEEHDAGAPGASPSRRQLCVHRKGATRAFGPGRAEVPAAYREWGQPVMVPGDMGTASYVLLGTEVAMRETWGSTCHGAGRQLSRAQARKRQRGGQVLARLRAQGITVRAAGKETLAEEAPEAYKDVDRVVQACHGAGISRKVARLVPLGVIKG